eukprot:scaffold905_cov363-Pavlova_lutheri.AAC.15
MGTCRFLGRYARLKNFEIAHPSRFVFLATGHFSSKRGIDSCTFINPRMNAKYRFTERKGSRKLRFLPWNSDFLTPAC